MSSAGRSALAVAVLALAAAPIVRAQDPASPPDSPRNGVCPCGGFHMRPRMSFRPMRPMRFGQMDMGRLRMDMGRLRMDAGRFRMRALDRSMARMDRMHEPAFALRDHAMDRGFELRERMMGRLHDRLDRVRLERPLMMHRRWRTI